MKDENWITCSVADIAAPIRNALVGGPFGSNLVSNDYVSIGIPVIRGQNMVHGRWVTGEFVYISYSKAYELASNTARPSDLVFTQRGTLGQVAVVPQHPFDHYVVSQSQMKLTVDPNKANVFFLYYFFSSKEQQEYIRRNAIQTGVPHTNLEHLRTTPLWLPPLPEQQAIAHILSTLDDKIELNRRMNETLEAIASAIFKSWFVDFDPVHAKMEGRQPYGIDAETAALFPDSFEDSVLGEIPSRWQVGCLGDIADNPRLGVHPEDIPFNTPYIGLEHMPRKSIALGEWGNAEKVASNKFWFHQGDILFGKLRPYFHKVGVAVQDGVCSTDILVIVPQSSEWHGLVLSHVSSVEFINYANAASDGTRMPRTNWHDMKRYEIAIPPKDIAEIFNEKIKLVLLTIRSNILQSRTLADIRDALLPKLLSGEIRVKDAEKFVEANA